MKKRGYNIKRKLNKAQAAMEFLTTYGWAILILVVVITALATLGVFRTPDAPNYCDSAAPIGCTDIKIDEGGNLNLALTANFVSSAYIAQISLSTPVVASCIPNPNILKSRGITNIDCKIGQNLIRDQRFSGSAIVNYILSESSQQHTVKINFNGKVEPGDTPYAKAISFNGVDEACLSFPPIALDLNGAEKITSSNDNREFEGININWQGNGGHSISRTTENPLFGVASGLITASATGSQQGGYVQLDSNYFTGLEQGKKYTVEIFANSDQPGTAIGIGFGSFGQSKQSNELTTVPGQSTKIVFNLLAGANDVSVPLRIWSTRQANVRIDNISITEAYDALYLTWVEYHTDVTPINGNGGAFFFHLYYSTAPAQVLYRWYGANSFFGISLEDGTSATGGSNFVGDPDGRMHLIAVTFDRVSGIRGWVDGAQRNLWPTTNIGKILANNISIGSTAFTGKVGETQMIRFKNGLPANIATLIPDVYNNGIPQGWQDGEVLIHYKWQGATEAEFLRDETGNNQLTCINVNRQENQISVNYPLR